MNLKMKKQLQKKKDMLRSAAMVISKKGYHRATMDDIAAELLMTKGALYYYFANKEELIFQCHEMILSEAIEEIEAILALEVTSIEKMEKAIIRHIYFAIDEKEMFNMLLQPESTFADQHISVILEKREKYSSLFDEIIAEGKRNGSFRVKEAKMVRMIILGAMNWIQQWYSSKGEQSKEDVAKIYAEYLLKILI
ncbi:TetR/AcrR family transcriptional regulator [Niallia oryzisoli]|uniref:TetR/AcrR family transcriptional regulator n=1 Tax=Niallia oryzisoli TaxID=1737571 RepID=A0ABZ2CLG8_9BACI